MTIKRRKNRKDKTPRLNFLPSFDVFWKHVKTTENGVDVTGLFSKECFEEWLATRPGKAILHPEQSYQRVLYAHIRGADHRKPFPENVEREVLKLLRGGKQNNPWKRLFQDRKVDVGRRGFKSKGFHELNQGAVEPQLSTTLAPDSSETNRRAISPSQTSSETDSTGFGGIQLQPSIDCSNMTIRTDLNMYSPFTNTPEEIEPEFVDRANGFNLKTPWQRIYEVMIEYVPYSERKLEFEFANFRGVDIYSPAVYYMLNQVPDPRDKRFDWGFLLPPIEEQKFFPDRKVGSFIFSTAYQIVGEDENSIQLFRGSICGIHVFELAASLVTILYATMKHIPEMYTKGLVWRREIMKKVDGSPFVALHRVEHLDNGFYKVFLQDVSDLFPDVLARPIFI